ncbi:hypothetical protein H9W90_11335 [Polaribacter pectinis]|uniref:Lipoprotein n=1 Tax=Polaribacter pectinis TaxID=2738844 RepID=A0A7G9L837_9FLAO|nr:hypothetical protein [Polaribacter pectinis]QNM84786.1 hypothetical protein H9W90_11335 [Polaribacter pectinis]
MKKNIVLILSIILLQSCYFGAGLIEEELPGSFMLFANNSIEELSIINNSNNKSIYNIVVDEAVFAVGFNKEYIIAKSYSVNKNLILYHIIEVEKELNQINLNLSFQDYKLKRESLKLPYDLNFTLVYHEIAKN